MTTEPDPMTRRAGCSCEEIRVGEVTNSNGDVSRREESRHPWVDARWFALNREVKLPAWTVCRAVRRQRNDFSFLKTFVVPVDSGTARRTRSRPAMCHCLECQRRTGAVISNQARFRRDQVTIAGKTTAWMPTRVAKQG
jgi:hypothetical protein